MTDTDSAFVVFIVLSVLYLIRRPWMRLRPLLVLFVVCLTVIGIRAAIQTPHSSPLGLRLELAEVATVLVAIYLSTRVRRVTAHGSV